MASLIKRITSALLATALLAQPLSGLAYDLDSAFTNLIPGGAVSANSPGRYNSAARSGFSAGGVELRVPRGENAPALLSVTPPRITAGCGGISAHFGGFSFISGEEFVNLIKQIGSGAAMGFVSSLVMKQLCPQCDAVITEMRAAAQQAARLATDSCQIGQEWARKLQQDGTTAGGKAETCSNLVANAGGASDPLKAFSSVCGGLASAADAMRKFATPTTDTSGKPLTDAQKKDTQDLLDCTQKQGNVSWAHLQALNGKQHLAGLASTDQMRMLMLINMMGANMAIKSASAEVGCQTGDGTFWVASETSSSNFCAPPMDTQALTGLFLCGAPDASGTFPGNPSTRVREYCRSFFSKGATGANAEMWTCTQSPALGAPADWATCNFLARVPASTHFSGQGFLTNVNTLLRDAVRRVRTGQPMGVDLPTDTVSGQAIIRLINAAPFPLYQAINAAAVYPAAADDMLDAMSLLVAEQFTYSLLDEVLRVSGRASNGTCISQEQASKLLDFVAGLRSESAKRQALIAQNFSVQQMLVEQIRQVNLAIQKQVMSQDLLSTGRLGQSLNNAVTSNGSNPAGAAAP